MDSTTKSALKKVAVWVVVAMICNVLIYYIMGQEKALQFLGGYLIEFSLSIDNLFVFITLFCAFNVSLTAQHKCLTYGIISAMILRLIFISLGVAIVNSFSWILYVFGFVLIISGIKMFYQNNEAGIDISNSRVLKLLCKFVPMSHQYDGDKFFTRINGRRFATPLLAVLVMIEFSDILFAIDSVPAIFSVSTDLIIVYTSNICAILGLRQLYFVLEHLHNRFIYVKYGVAAILTFTGIKLALLIFDMHISILISISVIILILILSIIISVIITGRNKNNQSICSELSQK